MPIRINLLAEAQAAEELRRRDPVKRAIVGAILFVALVLVWSSSLQLKAMLANRDLARLQATVDTHTNEYQVAELNGKKIAETKAKLAALQRLSTTRFLQGNLLNALQQVTVDGVALTRVRVDQSYAAGEGGAARKEGDRATAGKSSAVTERIVVILDARDSSANPGDQVNQYKNAIESQAYFHTSLAKTNAVRLVNLSTPQSGPDERASVMFSLECHYPLLTR